MADDFDTDFSDDAGVSSGTGPPYPPLPGPGSNAVGIGAVGESQIGDIPPFDWWQTVISQYANSPILIGLIQNFFEYVDQTENVSSFFDNIMNLDTAQGYGLDVWGRIVGVNRVLKVASDTYFGFQEALPGSAPFNDAGPVTYQAFGFQGTGAQGFNQSTFGVIKAFLSPRVINFPFFTGETITSNVSLTDETYRTLIYAKAAANITNGSIPAINQILLNIFPHRGNCYVTEGPKRGSYFGFAEAGDAEPFNQGEFYRGQHFPRMQMQYVFEFPLSPLELAIVEQSVVLPKPTGVLASTLII